MSLHQSATVGFILSALSITLVLVLVFSIDSIPLVTRLAALGAILIFFALAGTWWVLSHWRRSREGSPDMEEGVSHVLRGAAASAAPAASLHDGVGPTMFRYPELARATNNFDDTRKLGQGGFGSVYLGLLRGCEVAIKKIIRERDGERCFMAEVKTIGQLNQKNLVPLLGWCRSGNRFYVVYEYMPNRSLDRHLFPSVSTGAVDDVHQHSTPLPWEKRYTIVLGLASALKYLHEDLRECVVHRDVKPANIMLDAEFKARLGDFGLARFVKHGNSVVTSQNAGTVEYMAPEILYRGRGPSKESDVYSFGVVALEVACGKKASSQPELMEEKMVAWVRRCYESGDLLRTVDEGLGGRFDVGQMRRLMMVGLMCTLQDRNVRPTITQIIHYLHPEATIPDVPVDTPPLPSPPPLAVPPRAVLPVSFVQPITNTLDEVGGR